MRGEKLLVFPSALLSLIHDMFTLRADAEVIDFITFLAFPSLFSHFHQATKKKKNILNFLSITLNTNMLLSVAGIMF